MLRLIAVHVGVTSPKTNDMACASIPDVTSHFTEDLKLQYGNLLVVVTKGDLTKENADAIDNSTDNTLYLSLGMLSISSTPVVKRIAAVNCRL